MDSRRELADRIGALSDAMTEHLSGSPGDFALARWALPDEAKMLAEAAQALRRQPSVEECLSALKPFADAADTRVTDFRSGAGEVFTPADTEIFPAGLITWGDIRKARQIASLYGGEPG